MKVRILAIAIVVGATGAVSAQSPVPVQLPPDARHQLSVFENSLREAVFRAGSNLLDKARQVVQDIELRFQTDPGVFSTLLPGNEGALFVVEVPAIDATSAALFQAYLRMGANRPVNSGSATVVVPTLPPGAGTPVIPKLSFDPNMEYSEFTRKALVDAMLDNAFALPLKEGQTLTVMVKEGTPSRATTMPGTIGDPPKRLYLTIKAEDLLALRQTRITREEAQKRIVERRY